MLGPDLNKCDGTSFPKTQSCYCSTHHSTSYFWECVLFRKKSFIMLFFIWNFFIRMTFRLANTSINTVSYSSLNMLYGLSDEMWDVGNVVCYGSGILSMWNVGDVWMLGMWDVWDVVCQDVGCLGCGMFGMWYFRDTRCLVCGMFEMWDVQDVACWGLWDVRGVGCWRCDMFRM